MVVDRNWDGDIELVRVKVAPSPNLRFSNELENIRVCRPEIII